jgi:hypothetical protein
VTWKQKGIRHDTKNNRVRLSKGRNHKEYPRARVHPRRVRNRARRHGREPATGSRRLRPIKRTVGDASRLQRRNRDAHRPRY